MKKQPFKDPLEPKQRVTSVNYRAPTKNEAAMTPQIPAGDDYGVGFNPPEGTKNSSGASRVPKGARQDLYGE